FLVTDKPVYQPNQVMHLRALAAHKSTGEPLAEKEITLEVYDGKGNKVFKETQPTSEFGIVSADFQLADEVNQGDYIIKALLGDEFSERTVQVFEYVLPKFKVTVKNDEKYYAPGDEVKGTVEARYFFGKALDGAKVTVVAHCFDVGFNEFAKVEGTTNAEGIYHYTYSIPERLVGQPTFKGNTLIQMEVKVRDTADHEEQKYETFHVASDPLQIDIIPESGKLVMGATNQIFLVASRPDGSVATPRLRVQSRFFETPPAMSQVQNVARMPLEKEYEITCDENGIATVSLFATTEAESIQTPDLRLTALDGDKTIQIDHSLPRADTLETILLRPDKGVYRVGESMRVDVFAPGHADGTVFVDIIKANQTVLTRTVRLHESHTLAIPLDNMLAGTLALHAYIIRADGNMIRDTRQVVVVRADDLQIDITADQVEYLPGQPAMLKIAVHDPNGAPVQAALGMHIVDESVYSLTEKEPGLAKIFFAIEKELLDPEVEIHGFQMDHIVRLSGEPLQDNANLSRALLAKLDSWTEFSLNIDTVQEKNQRVSQEIQQVVSVLMNQSGFYVSTQPRSVEEVVLGFDIDLSTLPLLDPWGQPYQIYAEPNQGVILFCLGRDGQALSEDDITFTQAQFQLQEEKKNLDKGTKEQFQWYFAEAPRFHRGFARGALGQERFLRAQDGADGMIVERMAEPMMDMAMEAPMMMDAVAAAAPAPAFAAGMGGMADQPLILDSFGGLHPQAQSNEIARGDFKTDIDSDFELRFPTTESKPAEEEEGAPLVVDGLLNPEALSKAADAFLTSQIQDEPVPKIKKEDVRVRRYFPETLFYTPELITDARGEARVSLAMADSITTWRMSAMANAKSGAIGDTTAAMKVFKPFFIDLDLPIALIQSDEVTIPVAIYNYLPTAQTIAIELEKTNWFHLLEGDWTRQVQIAANEVSSVTYRIKATQLGKHPITVYAIGSEDTDAIGRSIEVRPNGEAQFITHNGSLNQPVKATVEFPEGRVPGADKLFVKIYPGLFSQIVEGLDAILQMPYGCFEQTSSTTYPNILALDYMRTTGRVTPAIEMKALEYINLGYQRLLTFEIPGGGFQVFGQPPATRILSAYGLLEFGDMQKVYPIELNLIERTQRWLMGQMKPDGTWDPDEQFAHAEMWQSIQDNQILVTAYIALALAESGIPQGLEKTREYLLANAGEAQDAYTLAILCNTLQRLAPDHPETKKSLGRLIELSHLEGDQMYWKAEASMSFARGNHAWVETTAWAALALIQAERYPQELNKTLNWIIAQKDPNGTWGTTHGTVLALKALVQSLAARSEKSQARITIRVNGEEAKSFEITPENSDIMQSFDLTSVAGQPKNEVEIGFEGNGRLLYQIVGKYFVSWEKQKELENPLAITVEYDRTTLQRNDSVTCNLTAKNSALARMEMVMIDLGIPPGFRVEQSALEEYEKARTISKYTIMSRQLLIYLEYLDNGQELKLAIPMKATLPIAAKAPESTIYEYYNPEVKKTSTPQDLIVE
ncbi:MAG: alpha-2-macroglobulin family protein, partial [bacterium]|nr:alpha-2-macroglobulin family protein [bacterium]